jgi:hypothetical protein
MPLSPGDQLGPYEILDLIGQGGMGEVYRMAADPEGSAGAPPVRVRVNWLTAVKK